MLGGTVTNIHAFSTANSGPCSIALQQLFCRDRTVLIIHFPYSQIPACLNQQPSKPVPLIFRIPAPSWMFFLYFSVADVEQASAADLLMFRSSPCTSGVKGRRRLESVGCLLIVNTDFFSTHGWMSPHMRLFFYCSVGYQVYNHRSFLPD